MSCGAYKCVHHRRLISTRPLPRFIDISGFTNLATRLDVDALQRHINEYVLAWLCFRPVDVCLMLIMFNAMFVPRYFTRLLNIVNAYGGDSLRFMGDALLVTWALPLAAKLESGPIKRLLSAAITAACRCALELDNKCGNYEVTEVRPSQRS